MSKILYGVAGEGSGHSSRAKEITNHLLKSGHEVKILSYDRGYKNLESLFDVEEIFGLSFHYENNEVDYLKTAYKNLFNSPKALKSIKMVAKIVDEFKPDYVFTDFEPISAFVANLKKLPLISIDNQHRINNMKIEYPRKYTKEAQTTKAVINAMVANSKACLVTSFFNAPALNKKTFVFPPIIRQEIMDLKTRKDDYILVYITSGFSELVDILKKIRKKFIVYGFNTNKKDGNIIFKKPSKDGFLHDLANAEGVVANAGYTLMTEALYLHKAYLALPVKGQFEQVLNAYYLEKLGYGKYYDELDQEKIEAFLYNIEYYTEQVGKYRQEDNRELFKRIDRIVNNA